MSALAEWFAMGGYAVFVWPAYAIAAIVLGGLSMEFWRRHRRSGDELAHLAGGRRE